MKEKRIQEDVIMEAKVRVIHCEQNLISLKKKNADKECRQPLETGKGKEMSSRLEPPERNGALSAPISEPMSDF